MKISNIEIEEKDIERICDILNNYKKLNETIAVLQNQINEIYNKKKSIEEELKNLSSVETDLLIYMENKYNHKFDTNEIFKIIKLKDESCNLCDC